MLTVAMLELGIAAAEGLVLVWLILEVRLFGRRIEAVEEQAGNVLAAIDEAEAEAAAAGRVGRHAALGRHAAVSPPVDHGSYGHAALNGSAPRAGG